LQVAFCCENYMEEHGLVVDESCLIVFFLTFEFP